MSLTTRSDVLTGGVVALCAASAGVAVLALFANATQTSYYLATRDAKAKLEVEIGLSDLAIATTPEMGSTRKRLGKVKTFHTVMLVLLIVASAATAIATVLDQQTDHPAPPVRVAVTVPAAQRGSHPLVISERRHGDAHVVKATTATGTAPTVLDLKPGSYEASVLLSKVCVRSFRVSNEPLQEIEIACP